jgi:hypothetical protein
MLESTDFGCETRKLLLDGCFDLRYARLKERRYSFTVGGIRLCYTAENANTLTWSTKVGRF